MFNQLRTHTGETITGSQLQDACEAVAQWLLRLMKARMTTKTSSRYCASKATTITIFRKSFYETTPRYHRHYKKNR